MKSQSFIVPGGAQATDAQQERAAERAAEGKKSPTNDAAKPSEPTA